MITSRIQGWDHTLTGDGLAQIIADLFGAPPVTSMGKTWGDGPSKVYPVYVISGAAVIAGLSFIGKLSAPLHSILTPVLEVCYCPLWGYHYSGLKILVEHKIDFDNKRISDCKCDPSYQGSVVWWLTSVVFQSRVWQRQPFLELCCKILPEPKADEA